MNFFFWLYIFLLAIFWPVALWDEETTFFLSFLNSLAVATSVGFLVSISPAVWDGFRRPPSNFTRAHMHLLGAWNVALAGTIRFAWIWYYRINKENADLLRADLFVFGTWVYIIGGICFIIASKGGPLNLPTQDWAKIGALVAAALTLAGMVIAYILLGEIK